MKTVVVYNSQTGFARRYAWWIAEGAQADCLPLSEAKKKDLSGYEAIVFGGWVCAGQISRIGWFKKNMPAWKGKKLIVYCTGGSPAENPAVQDFLDQCTRELEAGHIQVFYCPGGFNYEKMPVPSRVMMKLFVKSLEKKKNRTEEEKYMAEMIASSYDITDRKYVKPILEALTDQ